MDKKVTASRTQTDDEGGEVVTRVGCGARGGPGGSGNKQSTWAWWERNRRRRARRDGEDTWTGLAHRAGS